MNTGAIPSITRAIITGKFNKIVLISAKHPALRKFNFNFLVKINTFKKIRYMTASNEIFQLNTCEGNLEVKL